MIISIESGSTVTKLGTKPVFNFTGSTIGLSATTIQNKDAVIAGGTAGSIAIGCNIKPLYNSVTIAPELYIQLPDELQYIKTINGVAPTQDGEFFIDGSECDSWDMLESGTGISIVDLCPSCTKCESIYRLKYEVENLKMWLNTLKDVNLYLTLSENGYNEVKTRALMLEQYRITGPNKMPACSTDVDFDNSYLNMRGLQLLQQYITTVHMWNYIVSRNNASTVIDVAPEDTTGFTVQTKRALTSCACAQTICCTIHIRPYGILNDNGTTQTTLPYPISVYVPDRSNTIKFEPLAKDNQDIALNVTKCEISTANPTSTTDIIYASTKTATTTEIPAKVAGTYVVSVKFLPFVYYKAWRDGEPINIRGGTTTEISGKTSSDGTVTYDFGISERATYIKPAHGTGVPEWLQGEPTESDYLTAKTVPTCSVTFKIIWNVDITWQVKELVDGTWVEREPDVENYQYTANGIRSYFGDILQNTEIPPEEPPEPDTENTTNA